MKRIITIETVKEAVEAAHAHFREEKGGKNADYIPYLKNVPSDLFGISVCLADGRSVTVGDTDYRFGIESVSKVPTAILAMNQYSAKKVLSQIGADATGLPFNSIMAILLENDHPSTPLVNAGAISACSMIKPTGNAEAKWKAIVDFISGLCGSKVSVLDELYRSESETNFNNRSIAWLLKNYNRIYDDPDMSLDLYTRQCSLGITARQLAIMAATIANCGTNPVTWEEVFHPNLTPHIASLMATVGFYEHTGDWLFNTGLPAKTGVGGGIIIDGKLYTGCNSLAGELGHIVIRQGGEPCGCGRRGCLEAYSSAAALVKFAHRALDAGRESSLRENGSGLNAKHICDAVDAGDALACELFETYCDDLACGLSSFINIFQPECIVLGGGLAGYGEKLLAPLRKRIEKETFRGDTNTELVLASLGNDAGLVGAAML